MKDLIARGETYQVNYTMRLEADFDGDPLGFFAAMARAQRSADHLAYLDFGDRAAARRHRSSSSVAAVAPSKADR